MDALVAPFELADAELDLVTGGAVVTGGLVNVTDHRRQHTGPKLQ